MSNIDLDVKTVMLQEERTQRDLQELKAGMKKLLAMVVNHSDIPEWLTLDQAVALKGLNKNTVKCNPYLRPGAGNPKMQRHCLPTFRSGQWLKAERSQKKAEDKTV